MPSSYHKHKKLTASGMKIPTENEKEIFIVRPNHLITLGVRPILKENKHQSKVWQIYTLSETL